VYDVRYQHSVESDVQDVFIRSLARGTTDATLLVTDELNRKYIVDIAARTTSRA